MKSKSPRPLTAVDRALAYGDKLSLAIGETVKARRRTHYRFGRLDVVVVETTDEPTKVYLTRDEPNPDIVEVTAGELAQAAAAVGELLGSPPPIKRKR